MGRDAALSDSEDEEILNKTNHELKQGLRVISSSSHEIRQAKDELYKIRGLVAKLQKEEAKMTRHTKNTERQFKKMHQIAAERHNMNNQLCKVGELIEKEKQLKRQRAQEQRTKVLVAGKKAADHVLAKNIERAKGVRKIVNEDRQKEREIRAETTSLFRRRRDELRQEFRSSKESGQTQRLAMAQHHKSERLAALEAEKKYQRERYTEAQSRVQKQKGERKGEEHANRQRQRMAQKLLKNIVEKDTEVV
jgi:hypothetical protein